MTLLYEVIFLTYADPDPDRLGTAERTGARLRIWAENGDVAIDLAKRVAKLKSKEWLGLVSTDAITNVVLEGILNDPLNPHNMLAELDGVGEPMAQEIIQ